MTDISESSSGNGNNDSISGIISRIRNTTTTSESSSAEEISTHQLHLLNELGLLSLDSGSGQRIEGYSREDVNAALENRFLTPKRSVGEKQLGRYQV